MCRIRTTQGVAIVSAWVLTTALLGCGPAAEPPPTFHPSTPAEAAALTYYTGTVKPILQGECYRCHFGLNKKGGFNMGTRQLLLQGGHHGAAVIPGDAEHSLLVRLIRHQGPADHPMNMPQKGKLSPDEIASISRWVADGAIMDR
ncbi:MAG: c-type cytochrome domain-containing protein [Janthinobacterium lividum]